MSILNETMILHGCDYNPEQWLDYPEILQKDIELMQKAHINCVSVGIFSWAKLEPEEGIYTFDWLAEIIDNLWAAGIRSLLATPSGARPAWMAHKYPEVLRVGPNLQRNRMGQRHNHCPTSPVYRQKVHDISLRLSERFGTHPGVIMWHLSNEYGGECFCPLCQEAFRGWLREKYKTLDALNHAWWTTFWSHTYTDWAQIEPPLPSGETGTHGLTLDWRRFVTDQTVDFCAMEKAAVREAGSTLPVTANLMGFFNGLNYFKFKDVLDVVSWDSYPAWHNDQMDDVAVAALTALTHDLMRGVKRENFLLMESTPSHVNWHEMNISKKPGMHELSSLQALAHGSNSVQYFQWRKGRGAFEKFHGAVVSHDGRDDTRVFRDVAALGADLEKLGEIAQSKVPARVAIVYDWENRWAFEGMSGIKKERRYVETVLRHYATFWSMGIPVDVVDMECGLDGYALVVAPLLYMYRAGFAQKLRGFVQAGGTLVGMAFGGVVDENDLCYLGETPAGLTDVYGLRSEEVMPQHAGQENHFIWNGKTYGLGDICERIAVQGAEVLGSFQDDFYAGEPAFTHHEFGKGQAYFLAGYADQDFCGDFYAGLIQALKLERALDVELPYGVVAGVRQGARRYVFVQNYLDTPCTLNLGDGVYTDMLRGESVRGTVTLEGYGVRVWAAEV